MSTTTDVLSLFKYDPVADADSTFNITQALNNNWDKLDAAILLAIAAAGAYNPEESYAVGDYCTYKGKLRKCSTAIPTGEAWTEAHWTTTTVAAEMQELSSQLSNRLKLTGGEMTGPISFGNDRSIGSGATETQLDIHAGKVDIRMIPENAVGNDISKCVNIRDTGTGELYPIATATPPQEFDLPLAEGVTIVGAGYKNTYSKDQFGIVRVWFSVHFESIPEVNAPVFTLPEGFRPDSVCDNAATLSMGAHYPALLSISASGIAIVSHGDIEQAGAINLHGYIEFPAAS